MDVGRDESENHKKPQSSWLMLIKANVCPGAVVEEVGSPFLKGEQIALKVRLKCGVVSLII